MPDPNRRPNRRPEPTEHTDAAVRRLLAEARASEPIPADVADRIDATLADLAAERAASGPDSPVERPVERPVADLAAARRRRNARNLLVAAAAVVVVGIGISRLDLSSTGSSEDSAAGDSSVGRSITQGEVSSGGAAAAGAGRLVTLDPDRFGHQVRRLEERAAAEAGAMSDSLTAGRENDKGAGSDAPVPTPSGAEKAVCDDPSWGAGDRLGVRYEGRPGVLIYRPAQGDTRVVDLYLCGRERATRSVTLPAD